MNSHCLLFKLRIRVILSFFAVCFLMVPGVLWASLVELQFEGTVKRIDGSYNVAPYGIHVGSNVSFTYVIDIDADAHLATGTIRNDTTYNGDTWQDFFHAEQVGGLRILGLSGALESHVAWRDKVNQQTHIQTGTAYELNDWWSSQETITGDQYFFVGQYFYGNGGLLHPSSPSYSPYAFVRYDLTLTSMTPVPIPGSVWLLCTGIAGFFGIGRKLKK